MNHFTISQLSRFSGVRPHTIRIWEKRYNALKPHRTEGNTRFYDSSQLKRLLNIVSLLHSGETYKASEICEMSDESLHKNIKHVVLHEQKNSYESYVLALISEGIAYDEKKFTEILNQCVSIYGFKETYLGIVLPLLQRVGLLWATNDLPPAQEHFISNLLRQKFCALISTLPIPDESDEKWVLVLPEDEFHELGLLFAHLLLRLHQKQVFYLGASIPQETLKECVEQARATHLLTFFVHRDSPENIQLFADGLTQNFAEQRLFLAAPKTLTADVNLKRINLVSEIGQMESFLTQKNRKQHV